MDFNVPRREGREERHGQLRKPDQPPFAHPQRRRPFRSDQFQLHAGRHRPAFSLCHSAGMRVCLAGYCNCGGGHELMKAGLRISIKDYRRHKNSWMETSAKPRF
jgi:hypothetical protein